MLLWYGFRCFSKTAKTKPRKTKACACLWCCFGCFREAVETKSQNTYAYACCDLVLVALNKQPKPNHETQTRPFFVMLIWLFKNNLNIKIRFFFCEFIFYIPELTLVFTNVKMYFLNFICLQLINVTVKKLVMTNVATGFAIKLVF